MYYWQGRQMYISLTLFKLLYLCVCILCAITCSLQLCNQLWIQNLAPIHHIWKRGVLDLWAVAQPFHHHLKSNYNIFILIMCWLTCTFDWYLQFLSIYNSYGNINFSKIWKYIMNVKLDETFWKVSVSEIRQRKWVLFSVFSTGTCEKVHGAKCHWLWMLV